MSARKQQGIWAQFRFVEKRLSVFAAYPLLSRDGHSHWEKHSALRGWQEHVGEFDAAAFPARGSTIFVENLDVFAQNGHVQRFANDAFVCHGSVGYAPHHHAK